MDWYLADFGLNRERMQRSSELPCLCECENLSTSTLEYVQLIGSSYIFDGEKTQRDIDMKAP